MGLWDYLFCRDSKCSEWEEYKVDDLQEGESKKVCEEVETGGSKKVVS